MCVAYEGHECKQMEVNYILFSYCLILYSLLLSYFCPVHPKRIMKSEHILWHYMFMDILKIHTGKRIGLNDDPSSKILV